MRQRTCRVPLRCWSEESREQPLGRASPEPDGPWLRRPRASVSLPRIGIDCGPCKTSAAQTLVIRPGKWVNRPYFISSRSSRVRSKYEMYSRLTRGGGGGSAFASNRSWFVGGTVDGSFASSDSFFRFLSLYGLLFALDERFLRLLAAKSSASSTAFFSEWFDSDLIFSCLILLLSAP